jgi:hypothetical protein
MCTFVAPASATAASTSGVGSALNVTPAPGRTSTRTPGRTARLHTTPPPANHVSVQPPATQTRTGAVATTRVPMGCEATGVAGVDVVTETVIDRPVADVAAYVTDPSHAPEWYENIESVEWKTEPPVRLGSKVAFVAKFLGRRLEYTYEFVEVSPARVVMRTAQGPFPMETTYTFEPSGDATRLTLRNRGTPAGFSKLMAPMMVPAMRRANRKDLAKLKGLLER